MPHENIVNPEAVNSYVRAEIPDAVARVQAAGASGPLEYMGAGMYGIVFCDQDEFAWKVFRYDGDPKHLPFLRIVLREEYEWLKAAAGTSIAQHVAKVYAMHPDQLVLQRECIRGASGGWGQGHELHELHRMIGHTMESVGWSGPEFKEDSYIYRASDGLPVLVDISMVQRLGMNLASFVEDVLEGRLETHERWHDLAFYLVREIRHKTIPNDLMLSLLRRLVALDPQIRKSFIMPEGFEMGRHEGDGPPEFLAAVYEPLILQDEGEKK